MVRRIRLLRGLTQAATAARFGIGQEYLCRIENGERPLLDEHVAPLAAALGVPPSLLTDASPEAIDDLSLARYPGVQRIPEKFARARAAGVRGL